MEAAQALATAIDPGALYRVPCTKREHKSTGSALHVLYYPTSITLTTQAAHSNRMQTHSTRRLVARGEPAAPGCRAQAGPGLGLWD